MSEFQLVSDFQPQGDQPQAIEKLVQGILEGKKHQILLGVTGSGKTFTIANVIERLDRPVLVLSHNKTLAAQLYGEFKAFFPNNAVEYFVSYYDYYQPEAYIPQLDKYIEKDLSINQEIEKLRLSATTALLSGRRDVIIVSSVSCIYGIGNPADFKEHIMYVEEGQQIHRDNFLRLLVDNLYSRDEVNFSYGKFRVKGDTVDVHLAYADIAYKIVFWDDEIEEIWSFDPQTGRLLRQEHAVSIYPASIFLTTRQRLERAIEHIRIDLAKQIQYFKSQGRELEAKRIEERVNYDIEMMLELGYCPGIENYSRYFDGRPPGTRPFCLLDYFPDDYITIIDESHVTIPQLRAMYGGDHSRKKILVEYGFRLPAAMDNRPLKFEEFEQLTNQVIYMSATPGKYELQKTGGEVVEQVVRPTGLVDPPIEVRPTTNQIDDLIDEIQKVIERGERVIVTTLTKRMAEELTRFLKKLKIRAEYIHSDVDTLKRVEIMENLRRGAFDVLIGINLLREGLDLPEVSLVAILDADKEGFLRSDKSLTQVAGRAARNINGKVIMYADKITKAMQKTIDETNRRRAKQLEYNRKHGITPRQVVKSKDRIISPIKSELEPQSTVMDEEIHRQIAAGIAADPVYQKMNACQLKRAIDEARKKMEQAAKKLEFLEAARYRDEMYELQRLYEQKFGKA